MTDCSVNQHNAELDIQDTNQTLLSPRTMTHPSSSPSTPKRSNGSATDHTPLAHPLDKGIGATPKSASPPPHGAANEDSTPPVPKP